MSASPAIFFSVGDAAIPAGVGDWLSAMLLPALEVRDEEVLMAMCLRGRPRLVILDARDRREPAEHACARLKADSYTAVVPVILLYDTIEHACRSGFNCGADEVIHEGMSCDERTQRLTCALRRSDRDVSTHPSTRLPGAVGIEAELARGITAGETFAVCYADLDHFKEYNDRYGYYEGDRVIRVLARVLHDVVKGMCGERGFVGHIGGDDFIFVIPAPDVDPTCAEIIDVFDLLVPYQYSEPDRRAGYFFGKDRRGQLHRVPLMTLSIGVVTNERRAFVSPSQVSELATEMKAYAKSLPGSVYSVDRRQDHLAAAARTPVREHDAFSMIEER